MSRHQEIRTTATTLPHQRAKAFYDWVGRRQDWQAPFENPAIGELLSHGRFDTAQAVAEFGCGTGRLAQWLLTGLLPPTATYLAMDLSTTMVRLAAQRLRPWSDRTCVLQTDGSPAIPARSGSFDRVIATYVLDLLSEDDIRLFLADAMRVLRKDGLLCNVSLTFGQGGLSRSVCAIWQAVHKSWPLLLGGCRPIEVSNLLDSTSWKIDHRSIKCRYGICSEILVAERTAIARH